MISNLASLRLAALGVVAVLFVSCSHDSAVSTDTQQIDALMTDLHERGYFNGAVAVGKGEEIIYEKGFGFANVEKGVRFTPSTPTNISSIAKTFTASAVLMLEAEGLVDLDEPVTTYLSEFPYPRVTIRHLLAHSSGLLPTEVYFIGVDPEGETRTNQMLLQILARHKPPLSFKPGTAFQYSNAGYDLAALLIEQVTGVSYAAFLEKQIFEPLKMDSTFVRPAWNRDWKGIPTLGYHTVDGNLKPFDLPDNQADYGSNLIRSSARDLCKWTASFYLNPVLNESTLKSGLIGPILGDKHRSAINLLSWYSDDDGGRFYFTGVGQGFHSLAFWDSNHRYSIVWVSNKSVPLPDVLVTKALIDIMEGRSPAPIELPDYAELSCPPAMAWPSMEELASLSGTWEMSPSGELRIGMRKGISDLRQGWPLYVKIDDGLDYHLFPLEDMLYAPGLDATIWFIESDKGRILHLTRVFEGISTGTTVTM